jgi:mRNA interferase HicA
MKRRDLVRHLLANGCKLRDESGRHSCWQNPASNKRSAVPRHTEISDMLAHKICKDLGLPIAS